MHHRRFYLLSSLLIVPGLAQAQPPEAQAPMAARNRPADPGPPPGPTFQRRPAPQPRNGTPQELLEQDVQSFFQELNNLPAAPYLGSKNVDGRLGYYGAQDWLDQIRPLTQQFQLVLDKIEVVKLETNLAEVKLTTRIAPKNAGGEMPQPMVSVETTQWRFGQRSQPPLFGDEQNRWRLVPPATIPENPQEHPLAYSAYSLGQPAGPSAASVLLQQQAISNVKQLILGVLMFVQDYDGFLAFDTAHAKSSLLPYIKNEQVFLVPGNKESFVFNEALSGLEQDKIEKTDQVVCFYDGQDRNLNYRFGGKAVVGFLDGHVKLTDPEEAKALIWEPGVKKP